MITTTTTPSAETPSATTPSAIPSAIPSAENTSDTCISSTYKEIKYELTVLERSILQFNEYLSRHECEWEESYKEDEWYMVDLFHASSLHNDVSLLLLRGIKSKLEKLEVK